MFFLYCGITLLSQLCVRSCVKKPAPYGMSGGSATQTDYRFAYFTPRDSKLVYSYEVSTQHWETLPSCQYCNSALVIIDGVLTTVGGQKNVADSAYTNELLTLKQGKWSKEYPPMSTSRSCSSTLSDNNHVIVIGGWIGSCWTTTVELLEVNTRKWYELASLPQPLPTPSTTICGNQAHVIGDDGYGYSCSLQALPSSDEIIAPESIPHILITWISLPHLPVKQSRAATLCGQLVIIGGLRSNSIHQLVEGQWVKIGSMSCNRHMCLSVTPSPNRLMIVGGAGRELSAEKSSVEECFVVY